MKGKTKQNNAYKCVTKGHALRHYDGKLVKYTKLLNVFFTTVVALKLLISSIFIYICQTTTTFQLRTQHIPLNIHLMRNNKNKTNYILCDHQYESVEHVLLYCSVTRDESYFYLP